MLHVQYPVYFWPHVQQGDGCWTWTAGTDDRGYGQTHMGPRSRRKKIRAHRLSYLLNIGPIPPGLSVLHTCDNPPCVRPDHLFLGTQLDNMRDMVRKGRHRSWDTRGVLNPRAKLNPTIVTEARMLHARGTPITKLAATHSVNPAVMRRAIYRVTWKEVL